MQKGVRKIGDVLANVLARRGYGTQQSNQIFEDAWVSAAGKKMAAHSKPVQLTRGVLEILVRDSVILQELTFQKKQLLRKLSGLTSERQITELRFRVGNFD